MKKYAILFAMCAVVSVLTAGNVSWTDNFDELSTIRWKRIPSIARITAKDTLSAANRVMVLSPAKGQQYFLSTEKFKHGDMEVVFSARKPKSGQYFYYIGFHANEPWLKSVCWVLIHNEVVNLMIKTPDNVKLNKKIGELKTNAYHRLKISQSQGKIVVQFDDKSYTFSDPKLLSDEPMFAFIGANTQGDNKVPAELRVDYMKVSGAGVPPRLSDRKISGKEASAVKAAGSKLVLKSGNADFAWDLNGGLHWRDIRQDGVLLSDPEVFSPVFSVRIDGNIYYSHELEFLRSEKTADGFKAYFMEKKSRVELCFTGKKGSDNSVKLQLTAKNNDKKAHDVLLVFPQTPSLISPGEKENTKYFFPWRGGLLGNATADLSTEYGGLGWMQLMFVCNAEKKNGLMFYPLDTNGSFKGLRLLHQQDGVTAVRHMESVNRTDYPAVEMLEKQSGLIMSQYYRNNKLQPGKSSASCEVLMATFDGNWKTPLKNYSGFMYRSMKPVTVPRWFRDTYTMLCAHPKAYYDQNTGKYILADRLAGSEHTAQLAFWDDYVEKANPASQLERYQPGDFEVHKGRGGNEAFAAEVKRVQSRDTRMTLYIDHRFCWKETNAGVKFGKAWGTMNQLGNYNGYLTSEDLYLMCFYDEDKWVKYMADTCFRLTSDLGLDGIYLDELGIAFPCYNPAHNHVKKGEFPTSPVDLGKSLTLVRNAMKKANPQAAVMTEHAGSDYLTQFYDGSWDQTFIHRFDFSEKYFNDYRLCIFRFFFPHFKISSWGASTDHAKRNLFNGMGMDMGGAENKDEQRRYAHLMKENGDAFGSMDVEPIVATTADKLLANRFRTPEKVIYTFFNTGKSDVAGGVAEDPGIDDCRYVELINDVEIEGRDKLTVRAGDVAVLGCFKKYLNVNKDGNKFTLSASDTAADSVIVCENRDNSCFNAPRGNGVVIKLADGKAEYISNTPQTKKIFKLMKDGYVIDQVVMNGNSFK